MENSLYIFSFKSIHSTTFLNGVVIGRVGLGCLTQLSTIFQLYHGGRFIGGGNRSNKAL